MKTACILFLNFNIFFSGFELWNIANSYDEAYSNEIHHSVNQSPVQELICTFGAYETGTKKAKI